MHTATLDPDVVITARGTDSAGVAFVRYARASRPSEAWTVRGTCNRCGLCEVGVDAGDPPYLTWRGPVGTPGAVIDLRVAQGRADVPVGPTFTRDMRQMARAIGLAANPCTLTVAGERA